VTRGPDGSSSAADVGGGDARVGSSLEVPLGSFTSGAQHVPTNRRDPGRTEVPGWRRRGSKVLSRRATTCRRGTPLVTIALRLSGCEDPGQTTPGHASPRESAWDLETGWRRPRPAAGQRRAARALLLPSPGHRAATALRPPALGDARLEANAPVSFEGVFVVPENLLPKPRSGEEAAGMLAPFSSSTSSRRRSGTSSRTPSSRRRLAIPRCEARSDEWGPPTGSPRFSGFSGSPLAVPASSPDDVSGGRRRGPRPRFPR